MHARMNALAVAALVSGVLGRFIPVQQAPPNGGPGDWPMFRHDAAGTGHSPLTQITPDNVVTLAQTWSYRLQSDASLPAAGGRALSSEATPIVVNGVMYLPAANRVVALEPETGHEVWQYAVTAPSRRGVAYWAGDDAHPPRIVFTAGRRLIALNARTGAPEPTFGHNGEVDMVVPYNSVPFIHKRVIVAGANTPPGAIGGIGNPRAFDAVTGAKMWEFSSVAQPGQVGHDTWDGDSWKNRLGVNAWPFYFTMDEGRCSTCRWRLRFPIRTAATAKARISTGTRSSRWTSTPAGTGGISRPSITICGTPIRRRLPDCSTSRGAAARSPHSR
jgi:glucose dehydrogenase